MTFKTDWSKTIDTILNLTVCVVLPGRTKMHEVKQHRKLVVTTRWLRND